MINAKFKVKKGPIQTNFLSVADAEYFCSSDPEIEIKGDVIGDQTSFKVRLADNLLNYVLVISGINYTYGFPLDRARGLSLETRLKLYSSGLKKEWWFLAASILASEVDTLDELLDILTELESFLHDGEKSTRIRLAFTEDEYEKIYNVYPEVGTWQQYIDGIKKRLNRDSFRILRNALNECYSEFYKKYWDKRFREMEKLSEKLKKATDILVPIKSLEKITGLQFENETLEIYPIDIFREGGGIYGAYPNRITCCSSECTIVSIYLDIAHEAGHLIIKDWSIVFNEEIRRIASELGYSNAFGLANILEEHIVALIQLKVDMMYIGRKRITHGFMNNQIFKIAEETWNEVEKTYSKFDFNAFIEEFLEKIIKNRSAKEVLIQMIRNR